VTVSGFLTDTWLPVVRHDLAPSTFASYRGMVTNRLVPQLGGVRLQDLGPGHIAKAYDALRADGANKRGKAKKALSETSIEHTHRTLHAALSYAVSQGLIARNPADGVRKPKRIQTEMKVWDRSEVGRFLTAVAGDRLAPLWRVATHTGLRRSELLGLRWEDVDLEAARLSVRRKRVAVGYRMVEGLGGKTDRSTRVVDLDKTTVSILRRWHKAQAEERLAWGPAWVTTGLVFTREDGTGLHADHVAGAFAKATKTAGISVIRFHDLRHTHASLLLAAGEHVKVVSERLGHASPAFTMAVYQHVLPGMGAQAARSFAALVDAGAND
jgi:integrase